MTHQSMPIYMPSTVQNIEEWLTLLRQDSPALHSQQPDKDLEKLTLGTSFPKPLGSFGTWSQDSSSWKMSEDWLMGLTHTQRKSLGNFPRQGTVRGGVCVPQLKQVLHTSDQDGGALERWPTPDSSARGPSAIDLIAENGKSVVRRESRQRRGINLETATRMWPTPRSTHRGDCTSERYRHSPQLPTIVKMEEEENYGGRVEGSLNPNFVEWLMGLPIGWTCLEEKLSTDRYNEWLALQQDKLWWKDEFDIPRLTKKTKDRTQRLKALGNGIVPATLSQFLIEKII